MWDIVINMLAGVGVLALLVLAGALGGLVWLVRASREPEGVVIAVRAPRRVRSGETFELVVEVTDTLGRDRTVRDINLFETLTEAVRLVSVEPPHKGVSYSEGLWAFTMDLPLAAQGAAVVTFVFRAGEAGMYAGDLDVSVDGVFRSKGTGVEIEVAPAV